MNQRDIIRTFIKEAFNNGNTRVVNELIAPDYRYTSPSDEIHGPDELTAFISAFRSAFPDLSVTPIDQTGEGEKVCTRIVVKGTHLGEFLDMPATGNKINIEGVVISRFENGLIAEEWELLDQYKFLSQLGAIKRPS